MTKKIVDIAVSAEKAEKNIKTIFGKAKEAIVNAVDQNDDGSFDLKDISAMAENIGNAAKTTADAVKSAAEEKSRELERKRLQPIFASDLDNADFLLSKLVRITEMDKKRAESEVCAGSIGYFSDQKELRIVNIYKDSVKAFGLDFFPDTDCELYYVDPSDRDRYIALDEYFDHLKMRRINELQKIAQDLGAKHFRVVYKEQKATFSGNTEKGKGTVKLWGGNVTAEAEHELASSEVSMVEVAAEMDCPGHALFEPKLYYLQREPCIQTLIALRMDKDSPITHQKYTLKLSNTSGIKEKDAIKIDAALKAMKISGNTTVTSEVRNESRRFFEYEIDF